MTQLVALTGAAISPGLDQVQLLERVVGVAASHRVRLV
jgi:hypothetical protein